MNIKRRTRLAAVMSVVFLASCGSKPLVDGTQVAAKVNSREISVHQVQAVLDAHPRRGTPGGMDLRKEALARLVEQELAAQAAMSRGLDRSPRVIQLMEIVKREVLARALYDSISDKVEQPATDAVDRFIERNPLLFYERRRFSFDDLILQAPPDEVGKLKPALAAAKGLSEAESVLRTAQIPFSFLGVSRFTEELAPAVRERMSALHDHESMFVDRPDGLEMFFLSHSELARLDPMTARRVAQNQMLAEARGTAIENEMKVIRAAGHIEYSPDYANTTGSVTAPPTRATMQR